MRNKFDEQLHELNKEMIQMGNKIILSIKMAIEALISRDEKKAKSIMDGDSEIDHLQKKIEAICFNLLIQQQPVAKDLRTVTAAMKMVTDMERIGDHAADISELTLCMAGKPYVKKLEHIQKMAKETMLMLVSSIEAYVNSDEKKAKCVIDHDDVVDELFVTVKSELIKIIHEDAANGEQACDLLMVAKYLERIGDHATNISEWVLFSINGSYDRWSRSSKE